MILPCMLLMVLWLRSIFSFMEWRVSCLEQRGKNAELLHDWATQIFIRAASLATLVTLLLVLSEY